MESEEFGQLDGTFEINVIFNVAKRKLRQLIRNWNKAFITKAEQELLQMPEISSFVLEVELPSAKYPILDKKSIGEFTTTAVGGTFDHLHDGHKILLSMALFLTRSRMIIGITGKELLQNKKFAEALEPFSKRQNSVTRFLSLIMSDDQYFEIYQISDVCGPTGYLRDIDGLVISHETISGGEFVNKYRREHGFNELDVTAIKVIGDKDSTAENSWKGKISSTDIRQRELEKIRKYEQYS
ncbi:hypothetical protein KGF56_002667 [Candida oxycetoniae]|uniref:Cytidyltransferase-like domain-containing protein n=1 Tax=Candida oxycetoniae TaxID=497107 RepID=A0AAI9SX92_9ASCO|nr:uncharacterized protein KGF56_002667 [Candida oxycetoniae]KAI3404475.2 hypothetical protein KGF56_002667 [Candida oxycetoniae]